MSDLQDQMRRVMAEKNVTPRQISNDTGINESQLSRFFRHKVDLSLKKVFQVIEYLDCDLSVTPKKQP